MSHLFFPNLMVCEHQPLHVTSPFVSKLIYLLPSLALSHLICSTNAYQCLENCNTTATYTNWASLDAPIRNLIVRSDLLPRGIRNW
jgi:hypothetical protein